MAGVSASAVALLRRKRFANEKLLNSNIDFLYGGICVHFMHIICHFKFGKCGKAAAQCSETAERQTLSISLICDDCRMKISSVTDLRAERSLRSSQLHCVNEILADVGIK